MAPHDEPPRIIDSITSFGSKSSPSSKRMKHTAVVADFKANDPKSSHEQRLTGSHLRPTITRINVLDALEKSMPRCLDASQIYRILSQQFESLASASIYRALNDLWAAGLLVRTYGAHGRAFYTLKPDNKNHPNDTLRCHCAARLVFIEDRVLREHLRSLARQEGFNLDKEPAFTITVVCTECDSAKEAFR